MSVNIISLNQIVDLFASFAEQHYFIKDFGYGATSEIGTSRQMMFPYLWLSLDQTSTITIQNKTAIPQYGITILFMDKINIQKNYLDINGVNSDNSQEVLSDTLQILQDLITEIEVNWGNYGLRIEGDVSCFPGVDETTDKVCGWVGQFNLRVKHSNCITPMGDIVQTNISPINPFSRYLTCDTLSTCQVIQDIQTELSGITGGTGDLQIVTDNGNTTTNDIILIDDAELVFGAGGGILLDNYSRLREGTIDAGTGGNKGIAQICGVGYELKWEAGSLYVMNSSGNIIREVRYTLQNTPTINDDITKGFTIGSRWVLDNGDIYVCSDDTTGAAVWNLLSTNFGLFAQTGDSTIISATTTETSLIGGGVGSLSVPANGFKIGDSFRVKMGGVISNQNNHTLRLKVKSGSVILLDSGVETISSHSNDIWDLVIDFTIRNVGSSGTASILALGAFHTTKNNSGNVQGFGFQTLNNTTFDTTINNTLDITLEWGQVNSGDIVYSRTFVLNKTY